MEENVNENGMSSPEAREVKGIKGFFSKHGAKLFLAGFALYFLLLLTGTIAEIFKIESILNWWIWRPPGM